MKNIIKKTILFFLNFVQNIRLKKIIEFEDNKPRAQNDNITLKNLNEEFKKNGFLILDNYASHQEIGEILKDLEFTKKKNNWFFSNVVVIPELVIDKILKDKKIKNIILNYIGEDAKLDAIEANQYNFNPEKKNSSENWHYDTAGRRIKIYLFLNDCETVYTEYVDGTNQLFQKNYTLEKSRISDRKIKKKYKNISKIIPKKGSLFIFDTNGYHRGIYRDLQNLTNINNKDKRLTVQFEFSSKSKSDKMRSISYDSIGVRDIFFSKDCNIENYLIEENYITEIKNKRILFYDQDYSLK